MDSLETSSGIDAAPPPRSDWALFLDLDGTLIDLAPGPGEVEVPASLASTLAAARDWLGGALAIISGRTIDKIDELTAPLILPCSGEHGAMVRDPDGLLVCADPKCAVPVEWRNRLADAAQAWSDVIVEFKTYSIGAHFRRVPGREREARELFESVVAENPRDFEILPASMAFEIRPRGFNKGTAIRRLMTHPVFANRTPVFVGDDVTDEDGIRAAIQLGGIGLRVHEAFGGRPENVRRWLQTFRTSKAG